MTQNERRTPASSLDALLARRDDAAKEAQVRYLSGPEKEAWSVAETPFTIKSVSLGSGEFGQRWELVVQADGDAEDRIMTISKNRARDPLMQELQRLVRQSELSGFALDTIEYDDGRTFQWFKRVGVPADTAARGSNSTKASGGTGA